MRQFYEFFAGGGMARLGLGEAWRCVFANDISPLKAHTYRDNFVDADSHFFECDINLINAAQLVQKADLMWGSFPCQDLSLAGLGNGLKGKRSGLIWKFIGLCSDLKKLGRSPKVVVLENVLGLLSANKGQDFYTILAELQGLGYLVGALSMDAIEFLPQSRPRIFIVAVDPDQVTVFPKFTNGWFRSDSPWVSEKLSRLWIDAPLNIRNSWVWWNLPRPTERIPRLIDVLDRGVVTWDSTEYTQTLLSLMSSINLAKVHEAQRRGSEVVGTLYRRTRLIDDQRKQRVEVRFDGISGCLRTPSGGSSRQRIIWVNGEQIRSRLLTGREAATLMGLPRTYKLPASYNEAYQIAGDGVAVPVVSWLSNELLLPMLEASDSTCGRAELICA